MRVSIINFRLRKTLDIFSGKADDLFLTGQTTVAQYCGAVASVGVLTI